MLPRKTRNPLAQGHDEGATYPTIRVVLTGTSSANNSHDISVLDINTAGMGIACTVPLQVGQVVLFINDQHEWNLPQQGIVMWTFQDSDGFRAGIKFA